MRLLLVGDVHATPEDLDDCRALIKLVESVALKNDASVLFLGDQFHTHQVLRTEVLWFWRDAFKRMRLSGLEVSALVGNHDISGAGSHMHALAAVEDLVTVIDGPAVRSGVLLMPYCHDGNVLVTESERHDAKTLICHQTLAGAKYEGGFFAPDGVDPNLIKQKHVISGHIHTPQSFGKVTYIGAPRWRTLSDANIDRAIAIYDFDDSGEILGTRSFDTGGACRQIRFATDTPESPVDLPLSPKVDWRVDVRGPAAWVDERKALLAGPGVRLRTFVTNSSVPKVRESDGVAVAFGSYLEKFVFRYGSDIETLRGLAEKRLHV